jgi:hypothetical protein
VADFVKRGGVIEKLPKQPTPPPKVTAAPKTQATPPAGYGDVYEQTGVSTTPNPGGKAEKVKAVIGKVTHATVEVLQRNPEVLQRLAKEAGGTNIFNKQLPNGLIPEYQIQHPDYPAQKRPRIDRLWRQGKTIFEIKPGTMVDGKLVPTKEGLRGEAQGKQYAEWLNKYDDPPPGGGRWESEVLLYDQDAMQKFLEGIGYLPKPGKK